MTAAAVSGLRTFAFGDIDAGVWGAAWIPDGGAATFAVVGASGASAPLALSVEGEAQREDWRVRGDGADLILSPEGDAAPVAARKQGLEGFEQLCRVSGRFVVGDAEHAVESLGRRGARDQPIELDRLDSIRDVSAWFGPGEGLVLTALRPKGSRGHGSDLVTAAVFEPGAVTSVADPRLSTTYSASGQPSRVGLELWVGDEDDGERYPRRAAGEATGALAELALGDFDSRAELFRWHSRGRAGAGVYLLVARR